MEKTNNQKYKGLYARFVKRAFDIICSLLMMILFCWLYAILAVLVRINLGSPIIFHQERAGKIDPETGKEKIFNLCKFRSMTDARDENGKLLPDKVRLTKFGRILRATSLDELPEAWNILKGDMSIVGPRPWLVKYVDRYNEFEHQRHLVAPGLTGLAQVNGRNTASWKKRFELDVEYVRNVSFLLDMKIIFMTIGSVFAHKGIEFEEGHQKLYQYLKDREGYENETEPLKEEKDDD